jgi:hypothetical protein
VAARQAHCQSGIRSRAAAAQSRAVCGPQTDPTAHLLYARLRTAQSHAEVRQCRNPRPGTCPLRIRLQHGQGHSRCDATLWPAPAAARGCRAAVAGELPAVPSSSPAAWDGPAPASCPPPPPLSSQLTWLQAQAQSQVVLVASDALDVCFMLEAVGKVEGGAPACTQIDIDSGHK